MAGKNASTRKAMFELILIAGKSGADLTELKLWNLGMSEEEG